MWLFLIFSTSAVKSVAIRFYSVPDHVLKLVEMKNLFTTVCLSVDWTKKYKFVLDFKPTINKTYRGPFKMIRFIYRLASSDVILLDDYYPEIYKPVYDKNVKVIQVWHACGAFKALGLERMSKAGAPPINTSVHKCYTHVPVSSYHSGTASSGSVWYRYR